MSLKLKIVANLPHTFEPVRTPSLLRRHEREEDWKLPELAGRYPRCSTDRETAERHNLEWATPGHPFLEQTRSERITEVQRIVEHVELSLTELLQRTDEEIGRATIDVDAGRQGAEGRLTKAENRQDELLARREAAARSWAASAHYPCRAWSGSPVR